MPHPTLRFAPRSPPFAVVYRGENAELSLPSGDSSAGGSLSLDADGVSIRGVLVADEMPLYPAVPFAVSGIFVPNHERRLEWRSAKPGFLTVVVKSVAKVSTLEGELSGERSCDDVSIGFVLIDDAAIDRVLGPDVHRGEWPQMPWKWLRKGKVPLAATAGGRTVAEIESVEPPDDTLLVHPLHILAVAKGQTRVALRTFGGVLFGWVPTAQLWTSSRQYVDLQHDCFSILINPPREGGSYVACSAALPLVAEAGGERRVVGTVRAGTPFEPLHERGEWTEIAFQHAGVEAPEGAAFLLRTADVVSCPASLPR